MICPDCGRELRDDSLFCEYCGHEICFVQGFEEAGDPTDNAPLTGDTASDQKEDNDTEGKETEDSGQELTRTDKRMSHRRRRGFLLAGVIVLLLILLVIARVCIHRRSDADFQYQMALAYAEEKNYDRALAYAERAVSLDPEQTEYLSEYLVCLSATNRTEEIEEVALALLSLDPSNETAYSYLIAYYAASEAYEEINALLMDCPDAQIVNQYLAYIANPPNFSIKGGAYSETISLKLTGNSSGTIYYTLDGSEPDENSEIYTSPIQLEAGIYQVRAIFVNSYGIISEEASQDYYIDVSTPDPCEVTPAEGEYTRPTLIYVTCPQNCTIYYTTDGSKPDQNATEYTAPIPMPVGITEFRFVAYSAAGVASEEIDLTYTLNLHAALGLEAARNQLLLSLVDSGALLALDGSVSTGEGKNVYMFRYAVTIAGNDYYIYREYYEDLNGERTATGSVYAVDIMTGECFRLLEEQTDSDNPWDAYSLQALADAAGG